MPLVAARLRAAVEEAFALLLVSGNESAYEFDMNRWDGDAFGNVATLSNAMVVRSC
jgi:hypothetical protein